MGVEPFLVASSLLASMAQRLVRRLCKVCKEPFVPSDIELAQLGVTREHLDSMGGHLFRPRGCDMCNQTGYKGRAGIYELLHVSNPIRQLVMNRTDAGTIKKLAMDEGMVSLREYGANVVLNGVTSIEEILRLTQVETL
jgi:type II secretory ATPase GspE/PulE/Tfp pilus assembly ATPase PilB-like protein